MLTNRQLFLKYLGQTSREPLMIEVERAEGVYLYSSSKRYIDLISGVSVSNTGHCHPRVVEAVCNQASAYMHTMVYGEMIQSPQVRYAEKLCSLLPLSLDNCFFVNSGSEAVEGALKLAKKFTGRSRIISFTNAYHGSTHGALSIQGSESYKNAFRPLLPDTFQVAFNDPDSLKLIDGRTACVIVEPVQGEAGVILPQNDFLKKLRERCTETGALLIFDEVQTGFGRIGKMFALEHYGVVPDILVLAKALGGGMPLGAFIAPAAIMSSLADNPPLGHITTFGGHPVSCAAGLASLEVLIEGKYTEAVKAKSDLFREKLKHPLIREIRGEGLLLAVQLPDPRQVKYVVSTSPAYGMVLDYFLFCNDAFRIAPPLVIEESHILMACSGLIALLDDTMRRFPV